MRFQVDEVEQASDRLPTRPLRALHPDALVIGGDAEVAVIDHGDVHPLLAAVSTAFAQHRPLVLSPDAVWLTIAQGVAQHVRLNADKLRAQLVRHEDKKPLVVPCGAIPSDAAGWADAVRAFRGLLGTEIGDGRARLFECTFSTSTDVDLLASQIVLLDAYSPFFSLWMVCVCGIPSITLTGTVEDWREIRERIDVIAELDLKKWCKSLRPIADHFVRAAEGKPDVKFWQRIYNPIDAYGGEQITGWITRLYPYLKDATFDRPNPMLDLSIDEPRQKTTKKNRDYQGPAIRSESVPATLSKATVNIVDQTTGEKRAVALVAGIAAVAQDPDGALRPISGWHLEHASATRLADAIDRIEREHQVVRRNPDPREHGHIDGHADVIELYSRIERATLFDGPHSWQFRHPHQHTQIRIERGEQWLITGIADLPGGKSLCAASHYSGTNLIWLLCPPTKIGPGGPQMTEPLVASELVMLAGSLADILTTALDHGGDISPLEVGPFDKKFRNGP